MSLRRVLLCISFGLVLAILAIGVLPFLAIYSWSEIAEISELYSSPLAILSKLYNNDKSNATTGKKDGY